MAYNIYHTSLWTRLKRNSLYVLLGIFIIHQFYLLNQFTDFFKRNSSLQDLVDDNLELPYNHKNNELPDRTEPTILKFEDYFKYYLEGDKLYKNTWDETKLYRPLGCEEESCEVIMPEFAILGAQKCGTTSLWKYLLHHPQILPLTEKTRVIGQKEVRFFDEKFSSEMNLSRSLEKYMSYFPRIYELEKNGKEKNVRYITGEGTPNYIRNPLTPEKIQHLMPKLKLIVLFRDPVDRAYSHFQHALRVDKDKRYTGGKSYEEFVDAEIKVLNICRHLIDDWLEFTICYNLESNKAVDEMKIPTSNQKRLTWVLQTIVRGIYSRQLMNYADYFPSNQMLIIKSEEFYSDTVKVLQRIESFLDLKPCNWTQILDTKAVYNFGKGNEIFVSDSNQNYEPIPPKVRKKLQRVFKPFNQELEKLFSDRGFEIWKYDEI